MYTFLNQLRIDKIWGKYSKQRQQNELPLAIHLIPGVNFSPMSPKFVRTCSTKLGNYNGTIIFVIVLPTQLKIHISWHCQNQIILLFRVSQLLCAQRRVTADTITTKPTKTFVKKSSLTKIFIDWGGLFHDINLKKTRCHCNSPVFYYMWISSHKFW